jgi:hypothetical protein
MTQEQLFKLVKIGRFFPKYAPGVTQFYHKYNKWDGRKKCDFTSEDMNAIKQGIGRLIEDLKKI